MKPVYFPRFAARLKRLRKEQRWSLSAIAAKIGASKTYLWELEQDHEGAKSPSAYVIWKLAGVLGVGMEDLLSTTGPRTGAAP